MNSGRGVQYAQLQVDKFVATGEMQLLEEAKATYEQLEDGPDTPHLWFSMVHLMVWQGVLTVFDDFRWSQAFLMVFPYVFPWFSMSFTSARPVGDAVRRLRQAIKAPGHRIPGRPRAGEGGGVLRALAAALPAAGAGAEPWLLRSHGEPGPFAGATPM